MKVHDACSILHIYCAIAIGITEKEWCFLYIDGVVCGCCHIATNDGDISKCDVINILNGLYNVCCLAIGCYLDVISSNVSTYLDVVFCLVGTEVCYGFALNCYARCLSIVYEGYVVNEY